LRVTDEQDDATATAGRSGKRVAFAVYGVRSAAFILSTTYQLTVEAHGLRAAPLATHGEPSAACGAALRPMTLALDRGAASAASSSDEPSAEQAFSAAILPEWSAVEVAAATTTCGADPLGADALGAVLRLRQARERALLRTAGELAPTRQDVAEYLAP
jgi:hypothetical protein